MVKRVLTSLILLFSILFMPFWVSIIIALVGMIYFSIFWESIVLFFISDLLYGTGEVRFLNIFFISSFFSIIILIIIEFIKKKIRV